MSLETSRLNTAHADKALVSSIRENFRDGLLSLISDARLKTANASLEPRFRDQLMDDLQKTFNPDGLASDLFEAFNDTNTMLDEEIESLTDDLAIVSRHVGIAAE